MKYNYMKFFISSLLLLILATNSTFASYIKDEKAEKWVDSLLSRMTINEKIGQLFMIAAYSNQGEKYEQTLEEQIKKYHIGGLIFFQGTPERQIKLIHRYQKASKYPLMIGLDAEHGTGWRLKSAMEFPKMGIIGAVQNDSLIFELGAAIARHCKALGVHVNFAPVVDINNNSKNPVIGIRAFGEDREKVTQKAHLYIQGSLSENVLPVAKHFPGHGDTDKDSHHTLPTITHNRNRLDSLELYPYRALIKANVPAIMVSHLNVPSLDSSGLPASLSPLIVQTLLKEELQFSGLCFTDAMNMKGVTNHSAPGEAEVKALLAGNDVLLFPENIGKAIEAIKGAISKKVISNAMIDDKCRKILLAKHQYVLPNQLPSQAPGLWSRLNSPKDFTLKRELYKSALTLICNRDSLLPLKRLDTLQIASIHFGNSDINNFQTYLTHYANVKHFTLKKEFEEKELQTVIGQLKNYNCIIIYNGTCNNSSSKNFGYTPKLLQLLHSLKGKRTILCHPAIPYGLKNYLSHPIDAILISYENHLYAQQYAAQSIFGGVAINGELPVSIDTNYRVGTKISTPKTRLGYDEPESCQISSKQLSKIDSICKAAITQKATPGCQVLIAKNGTIIYNKAFGHHTYQKKRANKINDIYDIASVTKITATLPAIMTLYDQGKIQLSAPLSKYYSALETTDKKELTVTEVLCHNAGLKAFIPFLSDAIDKKSMPGPLFTSKKTAHNTLWLKSKLYANVNYKFKDSTFSHIKRPEYKQLSPGLYIHNSYRDSILQILLNSPIDAKKQYVYSDLGFIFLKYAVEEISGQSFSRFCKQTFYQRMGMYSTDFRAIERLPKNRIVPSSHDKLYRKTVIEGYVHDPTATLLGGIAGHAGLFSTAEDMAKMLQMYLNKGNYGGDVFFSPATVEKFTCANTIFPKNRRALGFDKPEPDSSKINPVCSEATLSSYGHTGFTGIMAWCDPVHDLIYIFMSNRTYPNEFNPKLSKLNIRTQIQEIIYKSLPGLSQQ